jgi:hypothetical protein
VQYSDPIADVTVTASDVPGDELARLRINGILMAVIQTMACRKVCPSRILTAAKAHAN